MRNLFIPIFLSVASAAVAAPPLRVEIEYELSRNGTAVAEIVHRLEHDRRTYTLLETWQGKGVFALAGKADRSSRGAIATDGLRPVEFEDKRTGRERAAPASMRPTSRRRWNARTS